MWLAVVSQPFDARCEAPARREIDRKKGEFWVTSPWKFPSSGENLSAYERNGIHLNTGNGSFFDISYLTGADSSGDGRSVVAFDVTGDGMPELLVRQAGGGPLLVFENRFPKANWLQISLRGSKSNSLGIGSKLVCEAGGKRISRELYPVINFLSQSPAFVNFGLGAARKVDRLTIEWPSGKKQVFTNLPINSHLLIRESNPKVTTIVPGKGISEPR